MTENRTDTTTDAGTAAPGTAPGDEEAPSTGEASAPPAESVPEAPGRGRRLRTALRWTSAVLVLAAFAGGTAYAVTLPERTDVPGLETPHDGRWAYPALELPRLPAGAPAPHASDNPGGRHHADLRALLLPAPAGAKEDKGFPGAAGWLDAGKYASLWNNPEGEETVLTEQGLRHIAARAWTMPDGTRAEIHLLRFPTYALAAGYRAGASDNPALAPTTNEDYRVRIPAPDEASLYSRRGVGSAEKGPFVRYTHVVSGDTVALVMFSRKAGEVPEVPYRQTVALQAQMLG